MSVPHPILSVVIPAYNEADNLGSLHEAIVSTLSNLPTLKSYEIIYVNDGSSDETYKKLIEISQLDSNARVVSLSRNFGKEIALTAGIHYAVGDAIITLDADGQHPVDLIPKFVAAWNQGAQVVVGVRTGNQNEGTIKRYGSKLFYSLFNRFSKEQLIPGSTDFRLIDKAVQQEFIKLTEQNRLTRGLIDWLGFQRVYIPFQASSRMSGKATYSFKKLLTLAVDSFVSLSKFPLYISLYVGLLVVPTSLLVGIFSVIEMLVGDPLHLHIHGTAYIALLILFSVGIILVSQGFIALYLSRVHTDTQNRPLYVVDKSHSHNLEV